MSSVSVWASTIRSACRKAAGSTHGVEMLICERMLAKADRLGDSPDAPQRERATGRPQF
jgi:hypothetical protein